MQKAFVRDLLTYLPAKLLPALTGFITAPILTRLFLPAEYGYYALAVGVYNFLFALACSGFGAGVIRFFPAYKERSELGVFFATLNVSIGIVIGAVSAVSFLVLFLLRGHLPPALYPLLLISILIFIVMAVFTIFMQVARSQKRSGLYTAFELLVRYGGLGLGLLLVIVFAFQTEGLLWGEFLVLALALPPLLVLTTRGANLRPQSFQLSAALQMWSYAWPLSVGNMAMWGLRLSDRYIIGFFRPASEIGLYSVAYGLSAKSIDMLVALFLLSMGPIVMNAWENRGREATEETLAMVSRLFLILCLPAATGLSLLALPFVALLTGEAYHEGYRIVGYVAFSSFAWGLAQIVGIGILIKKDTRRYTINQLVAAVVNLGLNLVLVPRFGFVAAGITTLVGYAVLLALQIHASRLYLAWRFPFKTLWNVTLATAGMGAVIWGIHALPVNGGEPHLGHLLLSIIIAVLVYFASLVLLGEANDKESTTVKRLWHRLKLPKVG